MVPALENGDHLTREEFERRYEAMASHIKKAELIEGVVYMAPPALRWDYHGGPHADLMGWLWLYRAATVGVRVGDNASIRLDLDNMPQPDAAMIVEPAFGGQAKIGADDYLEGAPELIGEVAASSVSIDMNKKLSSYRRNGVREYIVWRVQDHIIDWFELQKGQYVMLFAVAGIMRSCVFPGLRLDAVAMVQGQMTRVRDVLEEGLACPEQAAFVAKLIPSGMRS